MRLVNPAEVRERYKWYVDALENKPESALDKALNEATDYNDRPTDSAKMYDPQELVAVILTMDQWDTVQHWLQYGTSYHMAKRAEVLANCKDHHMAARMVAEHETAAAQAESVRKEIESVIMAP